MTPFGSPCGSSLAECLSMSKRAECARNGACLPGEENAALGLSSSAAAAIFSLCLPLLLFLSEGSFEKRAQDKLRPVIFRKLCQALR